MKFFNRVLFFVILFSTNVYAQSGQEQFDKQVEEIMRAREEMLKALMNDSMSGDFESRMLEIMKRFGDASSFGSAFDQFDSPVVGEYDWTENDKEKILKIKVKQVKDKPLDIKIEKGMIKIKGDVETTQGSGKNVVKRAMKFEKSFSLPNDIDQSNPLFENKGENLLIKFKKLASNKINKKEVIKESERMPVAPDQGDLSI